MTLGRAVRLQFSLLGRSRRPWVMIGMYLLAWVLLLIALPMTGVGETWPFDVVPGPVGANISAVIAVFFGLVLWRAEGPSRRGYQWSLPVDTSSHEVARVLAGAVWQVLALTLFVVIGFAIMLATGLDMSLLGRVTPFAFMSLYSGTLLSYVAGAAIATAIDHPLEWVLGIFVAYASFTIIQDGSFFEPLPFRFGPGTAIRAAAETGMLNMFYMTRSLNAWMVATLIWSGAGLFAMCVALYRNRGRAGA